LTPAIKMSFIYSYESISWRFIAQQTARKTTKHLL